jgi:hypothetical protein
VTSIKEELSLAIDEAEWTWLHAHLERGGLILVADSIDLSEAATMIASDNTEVINEWVSNGKLGKPSLAQIDHWNTEKQKKFSMLIVSPFVLIQEKLPTFH